MGRRHHTVKELRRGRKLLDAENEELKNGAIPDWKIIARVSIGDEFLKEADKVDYPLQLEKEKDRMIQKMNTSTDGLRIDDVSKSIFKASFMQSIEANYQFYAANLEGALSAVCRNGKATFAGIREYALLCEYWITMFTKNFEEHIHDVTAKYQWWDESGRIPRLMHVLEENGYISPYGLGRGLIAWKKSDVLIVYMFEYLRSRELITKDVYEQRREVIAKSFLNMKGNRFDKDNLDSTERMYKLNKKEKPKGAVVLEKLIDSILN